jgi:hypothetical protein
MVEGADPYFRSRYYHFAFLAVSRMFGLSANSVRLRHRAGIPANGFSPTFAATRLLLGSPRARRRRAAAAPGRPPVFARERRENHCGLRDRGAALLAGGARLSVAVSRLYQDIGRVYPDLTAQPGLSALIPSNVRRPRRTVVRCHVAAVGAWLFAVADGGQRRPLVARSRSSVWVDRPGVDTRGSTSAKQAGSGAAV